MSFVIATPEAMAAAAAQLDAIGSALNEAHGAAVPGTVAVVPAAADEVSAGIAQLFSQCAQDYHAAAGQAAAFGAQFVGNLKASAASYAGIEDLIAGILRPIESNVQQLATGPLAQQLFDAIGNGVMHLFLLPAFALQDLFGPSGAGFYFLFLFLSFLALIAVVAGIYALFRLALGLGPP